MSNMKKVAVLTLFVLLSFACSVAASLELPYLIQMWFTAASVVIGFPTAIAFVGTLVSLINGD